MSNGVEKEGGQSEFQRELSIERERELRDQAAKYLVELASEVKGFDAGKDEENVENLLIWRVQDRVDNRHIYPVSEAASEEDAEGEKMVTISKWFLGLLSELPEQGFNYSQLSLEERHWVRAESERIATDLGKQLQLVTAGSDPKMGLNPNYDQVVGIAFDKQKARSNLLTTEDLTSQRIVPIIFTYYQGPMEGQNVDVPAYLGLFAHQFINQNRQIIQTPQIETQ